MVKYDFSKIGNDTQNRIEKGILPGALIVVSIEGQRVYEFFSGYLDVVF